MSSDPRRLADYGPSLRGVVRDALEAERAAEQPDAAEAARLARIEAKLLAAVGAAPVVPAPPAPAAVPSTPPPPAAPPASPTSWLGGKGAIGALAVLAAIGAAAFFLSRGSDPRPSSPTAPPPVAPVVQTASTASPDPVPPPIKTVSPSELPTAVDPNVKPAAPARDVASATSSATATDTEEIALLARAHDALHSKPAESLELCREHERKFAKGHFAQEREAVAIEALVYLGRREEAEKRWSSFRAHFPGSSHRVHLETLFSTSPTNPAPPER